MRTSPLVASTRRLDEQVDLISLLPRDGSAWLRRHEGFVAWGEAQRFDPGTGPGRFERAADMIGSFFDNLEVEGPERGVAPLAVGSFTFDPDRSGSILVVPRVVVATTDGRSVATVIDGGFPDLSPRFERAAPRLERVRYRGSSLPEVGWLDAVSQATTLIGTGALEKVVLARDVHVWSETEFDIPAIVGRLALRFPDCFTFAFEGLVGASPERLVQKSGDRVRSTVLAGSAGRGRDDADDSGRGDALLRSPKDATEHELAVVSVRDVLQPLLHDLTVSGPRLLKLANVQHLATDLVGTLKSDLSSLELAGRLHPTAAVGGVPREDALRFITEHESLDRGRYSGPVGWVNAQGDGEWAIALRCAELEGDRGRLFAGAGVVEGSLPEAELEETRLKLRAMESVLGDG
jgi:menaquinone-specific isochorismate synthase